LSARCGHLVGDTFSYADMNLLPVLDNLRECPETREMLDQSKCLGKYFDGHSGRASLQATLPPAVQRIERQVWLSRVIRICSPPQIRWGAHASLQAHASALECGDHTWGAGPPFGARLAPK
jgi:hypothetical protein